MFSMKKKTIVVYLSALIILLSIVYRNDISIAYKSLLYKSEIDYAKGCIELLAKGNEKELRSIFIDNARFFSAPEYINQISEFLKGVGVKDLRLGKLLFGNEESREVMFLHFYCEDSGGIKNVYLKFIKQSNGWRLYSLMVG